MLCKDKKPDETIKTIRALLKQAGFQLSEKSWKHPADGVWSVHVEDRETLSLSANGKGITRASARASALAEFMERLNTNYFFADYSFSTLKRGRSFFFFPNEKWFKVRSKKIPEGLLDKKLLKLYDPSRKLSAYDLIDRMSGDVRRGICAIPFTRQSDKKKIYFPLNLLDNIYASNGMASGNTREEAQVQALSEIVERFVKFTVIKKGLTLPIIPLSFYCHMPHIVSAVNILSKRGFSVTIRDASLGGLYPVIAVAIKEKKKGRAFVAFGAHPLFDVALSRTMTELFQGQDLAHFHGLQLPTRSLAAAALAENLTTHFIDSSGVIPARFFNKRASYSLSIIDIKGSRQEELAYLRSLFQKEKKELYIAEFSEKFFYTCRVVVPGFSEIYPMSDLKEANSNKGIFLLDFIMKLPALSSAKIREFLALLDSLYIGDSERVADLIGVKFDEESVWHSLVVGELRFRLFLALQNEAAYITYLSWLLDSGMVHATRRELYECLEFLAFNAQSADKARAYFSEDLIRSARSLACGKGIWQDLFNTKGAFRDISAQTKIIRAFQKARMLRYMPKKKGKQKLFNK
jgi:ribosomal protein S12 methylthiotransferase accessory factor